MDDAQTPPDKPQIPPRPKQTIEPGCIVFMVLGGIVTLVALPAAIRGPQAVQSNQTVPALPATSTLAAAASQGPTDCAGKALATRDYDIGEDGGVLRTRPDSSAPPVAKPGVANDPDADAHATVVGNVPLREQCRVGKWSYVSVLAPEYLRWMKGWMLTKALKAVTVDKAGRRVYGASSIDWQMGSDSHKATILKVANKIMAENKACDAIDPNSLLVESDGEQPRFTLSCVGPRGTEVIAFSRDDLRNGRSFAPGGVEQAEASGGASINKVDAFTQCSEAIRSQLRQPRSVDFNSWDTTLSANGSRARFTITFSAKNGFGNMMDSTAECTFNGLKLLTATVIG